ncbi:MAG TPA: SigE family RNA polymerase sigma factor [Acidimicrobiales bacterium]|nr:SigE family RNA polymerase sigma factor [Acidimicrobiales bacterium]
MKRGDASLDDFDRFVAASAKDLLRTAYLIVWDLRLAEDLVQECFFEVARRWPRVRSMEYPTAYARRVLVNKAVGGASRRLRHRSELDQLDHAPAAAVRDATAERALESADATSDLIDALRGLAPAQRAVLVLRYFVDLSEAQIAETLGCSVGTVKSTNARALDRLRRMPAMVTYRKDPEGSIG